MNLIRFIFDSKFLPTLQMIICTLASLRYLIDTDWRKTMYWLAAAVITYVVTY